MSLGLDIQKNFQSRWVSVSTSNKFLSLDESQSRQLWDFSVSMSLGLDICKISQSRWVSVSTSIEFFSLDESRSWQILWYQSRTKFSGLVLYSLDNFYFCLDVFVVSVSTLTLKPFKSRSRHWDSDLFSLGLGLVIETQTFSVSVSVLMIQIWSCWSLFQIGHWSCCISNSIHSLPLVVGWLD